MVCDLLTGGDLRYHLQNRVSFPMTTPPPLHPCVRTPHSIPRWNSPSKVWPY